MEIYLSEPAPLKAITRTLSEHLLGPIEAELSAHYKLMLIPTTCSFICLSLIRCVSTRTPRRFPLAFPKPSTTSIQPRHPARLTKPAGGQLASQRPRFRHGAGRWTCPTFLNPGMVQFVRLSFPRLRQPSWIPSFRFGLLANLVGSDRCDPESSPLRAAHEEDVRCGGTAEVPLRGAETRRNRG
jgi:hypothetical protein